MIFSTIWRIWHSLKKLDLVSLGKNGGKLQYCLLKSNASFKSNLTICFFATCRSWHKHLDKENKDRLKCASYRHNNQRYQSHALLSAICGQLSCNQNKYANSYNHHYNALASISFPINWTLRDRSLILPGQGVDDIWEAVPKFCTLRWRRVKNKEHFKRRAMVFLLKYWSGDQHMYVNLRGRTKIPSNI